MIINNQEVAGKDFAAGIIILVFVFLPPFLYFTTTIIPFQLEQAVIALGAVAGIAGAIAGLLTSKAGALLGVISGFISGSGASLLFSYYAFYPPVKDSLHSWEILLVLGVGALPGLIFYTIMANRIADANSK